MRSPLWVWRGAFQPNLKLTNEDVDMQPILGADSKLTKGDAESALGMEGYLQTKNWHPPKANRPPPPHTSTD